MTHVHGPLTLLISHTGCSPQIRTNCRFSQIFEKYAQTQDRNTKRRRVWENPDLSTLSRKVDSELLPLLRVSPVPRLDKSSIIFCIQVQRSHPGLCSRVAGIHLSWATCPNVWREMTALDKLHRIEDYLFPIRIYQIAIFKSWWNEITSEASTWFGNG